MRRHCYRIAPLCHFNSIHRAYQQIFTDLIWNPFLIFPALNSCQHFFDFRLSFDPVKQAPF